MIAAARWALLAAVVAIAAFLRFDDLGGPSYWLDEILHQNFTSAAAAQPLWRWLVSVDGEKVTSPDEFLSLIEQHRPGERAILGIVRGGSVVEVPVTLTSEE